MSKTVLFYSYGDRENCCQVWNSSYSELNNALNQLFEILDHQFAINQQSVWSCQPYKQTRIAL